MAPYKKKNSWWELARHLLSRRCNFCWMIFFKVYVYDLLWLIGCTMFFPLKRNSGKWRLFFWLKEDPQFLIQNWSLQSLIVVYKGPWGLSQPHFNHRPKIPQEGQIKTCHGGFTYLEISKISDVSSIWLISTQWQWRKTLDCHNSLFGASCYGVDPKKIWVQKKHHSLSLVTP